MKASFAQLCEDLCALAGIAPVPPWIDPESGAVAVVLALDGIEVHLTAPSNDARSVYSRVVFVWPRADEEPDYWDDLLEANFVFYASAGPSFARDPWTGTVVVQQAWPAGTTAQELLQGLSAHVKFAREALEGEEEDLGASLAALRAAHTARVHGAEYQAAAGRFHQLRDHLRAQGLTDLEIVELQPGLSGFVLDHDDIQLQVWLTAERPEFLQMAVDFCSAVELPASAAGELAQTNALLLAQPDRRVICRMPLSPYYALCSEFAPDEQGVGVLGYLRSSAVAAKLLRQSLASTPQPATEAHSGAFA